jgi:hypothetical protein
MAIALQLVQVTEKITETEEKKQSSDEYCDEQALFHDALFSPSQVG